MLCIYFILVLILDSHSKNAGLKSTWVILTNHQLLFFLKPSCIRLNVWSKMVFFVVFLLFINCAGLKFKNEPPKKITLTHATTQVTVIKRWNLVIVRTYKNWEKLAEVTQKHTNWKPVINSVSQRVDMIKPFLLFHFLFSSHSHLTSVCFLLFSTHIPDRSAKTLAKKQQQ